MAVPLGTRVKRSVRSALVRAVVRLRALVPQSPALAFAALVGRAGWRAARRTRATILAPLANAFPERAPEERAAIGRGRGPAFATGHVANRELLAQRPPDREAEVARATAACAAVLEAAIRASPAEWVWMHEAPEDPSGGGCRQAPSKRGAENRRAFERLGQGPVKQGLCPSIDKGKNAMFQRFWTRTAASLTLAVSFAAAPGCRPAKPVEGQGLVPELKLEGVRFRVYRDDELSALGDAAVVSFRRDSTELTASDVAAVLPRSPEPVRITAPSAAGIASGRTFEATGGVTVSRGEDTARTERARYVPSADGGAGLVTGDRPVVVEGKGYRLEGTGFTLDPARGDITVRGGARLVAGERGAR